MKPYTDQQKNFAHYAAARVVADWLCGGSPISISVIRSIPYYLNVNTLPSFIEERVAVLGRSFRPMTRWEVFKKGMRNSRSEIVHNLFVVYSGQIASAHLSQSEVRTDEEDFLFGADDLLANRLIIPASLSQSNAHLTAAEIWHATFCAITHEAVIECIGTLASRLLAVGEISGQEALGRFIHGKLMNFRRCPDQPLLSWPRTYKRVFNNDYLHSALPTWAPRS